MHEFMQLALPSGHVFEIPLRVIADDRAERDHAINPEKFGSLDAAREENMSLFAENASRARDWLLNAMDVEATMLKHGRLVGFKPPVLEWSLGHDTYHAEPAKVQEVTSETIAQLPVELVLQAMQQDAHLCSAHLIMNAATGEPQAGIFFVLGRPDVVGSYVNAMQITTNVVVQKLQGEADAAAATGAAH